MGECVGWFLFVTCCVGYFCLLGEFDHFPCCCNLWLWALNSLLIFLGMIPVFVLVIVLIDLVIVSFHYNHTPSLHWFITHCIGLSTEVDGRVLGRCCVYITVTSPD